MGCFAASSFFFFEQWLRNPVCSADIFSSIIKEKKKKKAKRGYL
jgi:hypothetical protein